MTGPRDAAAAGLTICASMVAFAAAGYGLGSLIGAAIPLAFVGGFAGLLLGLWGVYTRFKHI
jgi:hypothetical protein